MKELILSALLMGSFTILPNSYANSSANQDYNKKDVKFMKKMIPHHKKAQKMSMDISKEGKNPEVKALADKIYKMQEAEINQMQEWLKQRGED